jgi:glycosyltransferase involved in cell wall biosynthesis
MISIITATYNRSNVLSYAIRSVLASEYEDWELIVVGDACTDDTESVVNGFEDPRIRFYSLEENFGDQSGPNNAGLTKARGEYVAYLNHDDLYFPDHLTRSLKHLVKTDADFVHSAALRCFPVQTQGSSLQMRLTLHAVSGMKHYQPLASVPASTWLVKRSVIDRIGPWKPATQCYGSSSQDWLFRAWRANTKMNFTAHASVLIIPSGIRDSDYANREARDAEYFFAAMREPHFRERWLEDIAVRSAASSVAVRLSPRHHLRTFGSFLYRLLARLLSPLGVPPRDLFRFLAFGRKGRFIQHLRKRRGLSELDANKQKLAVPRIRTSAK